MTSQWVKLGVVLSQKAAPLLDVGLLPFGSPPGLAVGVHVVAALPLSVGAQGFAAGTGAGAEDGLLEGQAVAAGDDVVQDGVDGGADEVQHPCVKGKTVKSDNNKGKTVKSDNNKG